MHIYYKGHKLLVVLLGYVKKNNNKREKLDIKEYDFPSSLYTRFFFSYCKACSIFYLNTW